MSLYSVDRRTYKYRLTIRDSSLFRLRRLIRIDLAERPGSRSGIPAPDPGPGSDRPAAVARPTKAVAHPTKAVAHPTKAVAHPTKAVAHPTKAVAHPTKATGFVPSASPAA
jgi:hypothetical protein